MLTLPKDRGAGVRPLGWTHAYVPHATLHYTKSIVAAKLHPFGS